MLIPHSSRDEPLGAEYADASSLRGLPPALGLDAMPVRLLTAIKPGSALARFNSASPAHAVMAGSVVLSAVTRYADASSLPDVFYKN